MEQEFNEAVISSKELTVRPSNQELLTLYGLYKQATEGDVVGDRPGGFDFKGAAKYDAWAELAGTAVDDAMEQYISLVKELHAKEGN